MENNMIDERLFKYLESKRNNFFISANSEKGNIPVISVKAKSLAEAWEISLPVTWMHGCAIRTEYDKKDKEGNFIDPPSRDCTMTITIEEPFGEPMIHKSFPGGLEHLEEYKQEVVDGIKDHWVRDKSNPEDKRWEYTYHGRLCNYKVPGIEKPINQIEKLIEDVAKTPYTRRSQAITWQPWEDLGIGDPACLQSIWCRMLKDENNIYRLNMNVRFRSRDALKASFMNMYGFINEQKEIAKKISEKIGEEVKLGRYADESDSYHIYGSYFKEFNEKFLQPLYTRSFEERTWRSDDEIVKYAFEAAKPEIIEKIKKQDENYKEGKLIKAEQL